VARQVLRCHLEGEGFEIFPGRLEMLQMKTRPLTSSISRVVEFSRITSSHGKKQGGTVAPGGASVPPLIPVTLHRTSHRTGDTMRVKPLGAVGAILFFVCILLLAAAPTQAEWPSIQPSKGPPVRNRAKVSQRAAQPRCPTPPDGVITTIAATAARRTGSPVC